MWFYVYAGMYIKTYFLVSADDKGKDNNKNNDRQDEHPLNLALQYTDF